MNRAVILVGLVLLAGCHPTPAPSPRYELGRPYQVRGVWFYPHENFTLDDTGLASVYGDGHSSLTANGEAFDQTIALAGHPTLQLPAVARLTNLETGQSILVRINDRGAGNPARLLDVTRRVALLLGMRDRTATRVRLQVLAVESRAAIESLPGRPVLAMATAPRAAVMAAALPPPSGALGEAGNPSAALGGTMDNTQPAAFARLSEKITQEIANPRRLWVRLDVFEEYQYAAVQRARMSYLGAGLESSFDGRVHRFWTKIGPMDTVRQAEDALHEALSRGIPDARIVVE